MIIKRDTVSYNGTKSQTQWEKRGHKVLVMTFRWFSRPDLTHVWKIKTLQQTYLIRNYLSNIICKHILQFTPSQRLGNTPSSPSWSTFTRWTRPWTLVTLYCSSNILSWFGVQHWHSLKNRDPILSVFAEVIFFTSVSPFTSIFLVLPKTHDSIPCTCQVSMTSSN